MQRMWQLGGAFLVAMSAPATPAAAAAQEVSRDCKDDRGVDRCAPEQHRKVLALYGLKPVEEHAQAGDQIRRVFYVDGYGRDMIAITFIRSQRRDPMLRVHYPRKDAKQAVAPAEALVPAQLWEQVLAESEYFDRQLSPAARDPASAPNCLHSWVYTVEALDPASHGQKQPVVRRKVEDACGDGLARPYATELAELALPLLPYCAALDPEQHRGAVGMLQACAALAGDRLAAAKAHNQLLKLNRLSDPLLAEASLNVFQYRASLDWDGEHIAGDQQAAARAWMERNNAIPRTQVWIRSWTGERFNRVRAEGELTRWVDAPGGKGVGYRAPLVLIFAPEHAGSVFQIESAIVGAFAPVPQP